MTVNTYHIPDSGFSIDYEVCENVAPSYYAKNNEVRARIHGVISSDARADDGDAGYIFSGSCEISAVLICDKCLNEALCSASSDIIEKITADGDTLDFTEVIRANICALIPMKILCTDDCKGLCHICGKNLNEEQCECEKPIDPRFAQLSSFFKEEV